MKNRQGNNYDCYFNYFSAHDYFTPATLTEFVSEEKITQDESKETAQKDNTNNKDDNGKDADTDISTVGYHSQSNSADRLNKRAGELLNLLKVQITPSTVCIEPNDAVIKEIFSKFGTKINVTEKHKSKRKSAVVSNLKVQGADVTLPRFLNTTAAFWESLSANKMLATITPLSISFTAL